MTAGDIASLATLVGAIGAAVAAIVTAWRVGEVKVAVRDVDVAVQEVKAESKVVAGHVNSAATAAAAKIDTLQQLLAALRTDVAEKKEIAALLAQAAASVPIAAATVVTAVEEAATKPVPVVVTNTPLPILAPDQPNKEE